MNFRAKQKRIIGENRIGTWKIPSWLEAIFVMVLGMYPMRHIYIGGDLMDTAYNYANFQYMGMEHMDPMWLFSTYLSNVVGNFITKLPAADSLAGMNFYTGILVSILGIAGYYFCTKKLGISPVITFIGEFAAISLCWCPTSLLYNYLTYVLFLGCVILLYIGLVEDKKWLLFAAGICLGTNILVRFSNLPEAAMIVAVWAYGVLEALERKAADKTESDRNATGGKMSGGKDSPLKKTLYRTLWCLAGYLTALAALIGYISIRYGLDAYIRGISDLFAMTDNATDYKATSMLMGMVDTYVEHLYWVVRIGFIMLMGMVGCAIVGFLRKYVKAVAGNLRVSIFLAYACYVGCVLLAIVTVVWLYYQKFCSFLFYSYDSMLNPAVFFLMLSMLIGGARVLQKNVPKEEKLISGMVVLVILLTSIGSNNRVYPSINNLFVAAPYTFWQCSKFVSGVKGKLAVKCIVGALLAVFLFQSTMFGAKFVFAEGTGVQNPTASVENNEKLKGVQMNPERACQLQEISDYVTEAGLQGQEVILYGTIPSLSYYLEMPAAFNPWPDLDSYGIARMERHMAELEQEIVAGDKEKPVVIVERTFADNFNPESVEPEDLKWQMILDFMEKYGYVQTFVNDKFVVME